MDNAIAALTADERQAVVHAERNREAFAERVRLEGAAQAARAEAEAADRIRGIVSRELADLPGLDAAPGDVAALRKTCLQIIAEADATAQHAAKTREDDTLPQETRDARIEDLQTIGQAKIDQLRDQAMAQVEIAKARLTVRALPAPKADREGFARSDAEATLAAAPSVLDGLRRLATDPDPGVRGLAAGSWGRRRLEASGLNNYAAAHDAIIVQALDHVASNTTGLTQKAAEAALALNAKAASAALSYATFRLRSVQ